MMELQGIDLVERVRELLPSASEDEISRAANLLAAGYDDCEILYDALGATLPNHAVTATVPKSSDHWGEDQAKIDAERASFYLRWIEGAHTPLPDARRFDGKRGGGIETRDIVSSVPDDPMGAAVVRKGRNRKGTTVKVVKVSDAPVIGRWDVDCDGLPLLALPAERRPDNMHAWSAAVTMAHAFNRGEIRRLRNGWSGIGVTRAANRALALADVPTLMGTDGRGFAQVINGDRSSRSSVAVHRTDLTGEAIPSHLSRFVAPAAGYRTETKLPWRARVTLSRVRVRTGENLAPVTRGDIVRFFPGKALPVCEPGVMPATVQTMTISALTAPSDASDRRFVGHVSTVRPEPQTRTQGKRKARTVATLDDCPTTVGAWTALAELLNRGERLSAGAVTITRTPKGRYGATDRRGETVVYWSGLRTVDALAIRLAS